MTKKNIFDVQHCRDDQKKIFSAFVKMLEIEVHSYCNRECWWCPNTFLDRKTKTCYLDEKSYLKVLNELADISYEHTISYSRNSEPFADPIFFTRLKQASEILPNAKLHTNTNGDYITDEVVQKAYDCGLRSLRIQLYLKDRDTEFSFEVIERMADSMKRNIPTVSFRLAYARNDRIEFHGRYKDMFIQMYGRDFKVNGTNKCGLEVSKEIVRFSPCLHSVFRLCTDYNGEVMPCPMMRSDHPEQAAYSFGNIGKTSIFEIFTNEKIVMWRKNLIHFSEKSGFCKRCRFMIMKDNRENRNLICKLLKNDPQPLPGYDDIYPKEWKLQKGND